VPKIVKIGQCFTNLFKYNTGTVFETRCKLIFYSVYCIGNYSRLACEFYFVRSLGYYIIQIYVPSSLIVVLSWVSFWLHRDAAPARVALGITTVLTMTTLISSTNAALPKISYLKSIDVYLVKTASVCMCLSSSVLLLYYSCFAGGGWCHIHLSARLICNDSDVYT